MNKEIEKRRALEAELAELKRQPAAPAPAAAPKDEPSEPVSLFSAEEAAAAQEALLDGKPEVFNDFLSKVLTNQAKMVRDETLKEARQEADNAVSSSKANDALAAAAADIVKDYPELDSTSEVADQGLIEETLDLREAFIARGMAPADALRRAANLVARENDLGVKEEVPSLADPAPVAKKAPDVARKIEQSRRKLASWVATVNLTVQ